MVSLSNHERANRILRRNHAKTAHTAFPTQRPAGGRYSHFSQTIDNELFHARTTTWRSLAPKSHTSYPRRSPRAATHRTATRARQAAHCRQPVQARRMPDGRNQPTARRVTQDSKKWRRSLTRATQPFSRNPSKCLPKSVQLAARRGFRFHATLLSKDNTTRKPTAPPQSSGGMAYREEQLASAG